MIQSHGKAHAPPLLLHYFHLAWYCMFSVAQFDSLVSEAATAKWEETTEGERMLSLWEIKSDGQKNYLY